MAVFTSCGNKEIITPKISLDCSDERYCEAQNELCINWLGEEKYEAVMENPEEIFWFDAICRSRFALIAKLTDYYESEGAGYWVFSGSDLVYGDYSKKELIIEDLAEGRGQRGYALDIFEIGKVYLLTVYTEKYRDYGGSYPYTLTGGAFIDISEPENSFWKRGSIVFPEGTNKEQIRDYILNLAITYGYDSEVME